MVSKATIATIWPPIAIRFTSTAGRQVISSPRMTKAPTGRASKPKPLPEPFPVPSGPSPSPPPPPPCTFATGISVTPSFSYGSPKTRFTVSASRACPRTSWTFIAPPPPFPHHMVPLQAADGVAGARTYEVSLVLWKRDVCRSFDAHPVHTLGGINGREVGCHASEGSGAGRQFWGTHRRAQSEARTGKGCRRHRGIGVGYIPVQPVPHLAAIRQAECEGHHLPAQPDLRGARR